MPGTVHTKNLSKTYIAKQRKGLFKSEKREVEALKGINLDVNQGEIFGLLGPNGAGKTTLIKILTTLLLPTSGDAIINGFPIQEQPNQVRASVGCMLMGERGLYWKLTGRENLEYFAALYHIPSNMRKKRSDEILDLLEMESLADRTVETYSSGQKMKLAFGKALINDAPLLILDEPTNTLDVPSASELRAIVRKLNREGKTIIYTTHIMSEAETLCDRVAIIDYGELLAIGSVDELKGSLDRAHVIRVDGIISQQAVDSILELPGIEHATRTMEDGVAQVMITTDNSTGHLPGIIKTLNDSNATIQRLSPEEITLEDVFIAKTGRTLAEDTRAQ